MCRRSNILRRVASMDQQGHVYSTGALFMSRLLASRPKQMSVHAPVSSPWQEPPVEKSSGDIRSASPSSLAHAQLRWQLWLFAACAWALAYCLGSALLVCWLALISGGPAPNPNSLHRLAAALLFWPCLKTIKQCFKLWPHYGCILCLWPLLGSVPGKRCKTQNQT